MNKSLKILIDAYCRSAISMVGVHWFGTNPAIPESIAIITGIMFIIWILFPLNELLKYWTQLDRSVSEDSK